MGRKKPRQPKASVLPPEKLPKIAMSMWLQHALVCVALGVITFLAYSNSFHAGLVGDNSFLILRDPRIRTASSENVGQIFSRTYWWPSQETGLYRPATTLSYMLNYAVDGDGERVEGYHWLNFLLHFCNVLLVYALAVRLVRKFWPAAFIAVMWAVHPVLTESVTNVIGRADLLAAAAVIGGFLLYLKSTDFEDWRRYALLLGLMVATLVGVFSKESAVVILGVIALYEITFWKERRQIRGLALGCAAVLVPIAVMLYQRAKVLAASAPAHFSFVDNPLLGASFLRGRLTALAAMGRYLWLLVWPAKLSADYSYSQIPAASGSFYDWLAWIVVLAVMVAIAFQFTRNRLMFFFGAFAFVTFFPVSNIPMLIGTIMAERFLYLPSIGFAACAVMTIYAIGERFRIKALAPAALCLVIVAFGIRTWERNFDWHDVMSFATASARTSPESFKTHWSLAAALAAADPAHGNIVQQIAETDKALTILDSLPDSQNTSQVYADAGGTYRLQGDLVVRPMVEGKPAISLERTRAYWRSLEVLKRGVAIDKANAEIYRQEKLARGTSPSMISPAGTPLLYTNLATTYLRLGNLKDAYDAASYARLLNPNAVESYVLISQALAPQGRMEDAAQALVEGVLVSGEQGLLNPLAVLYKYGVDPEGCGITRTANGAFLNNGCAKVHREICAGYAEIVGLYRQNLRDDLVADAKAKAVGEFGCAAER